MADFDEMKKAMHNACYKFESDIQILIFERDKWKDLADRFYQYYYLGEGLSTVVKDYINFSDDKQNKNS
jgi:hypothetical protein